MFPFPLRILKAWGNFFWYCGILMDFMEVNLTKLWGPYYECVFLEFLTLRLVYIEPPAARQPHFRFSNSSTDSSGDFHLWASVLVSGYSLFSPVSLPNLEGSGLPSVLPFLSPFSLFLVCPRRFVTLESVQLFIC